MRYRVAAFALVLSFGCTAAPPPPPAAPYPPPINQAYGSPRGPQQSYAQAQPYAQQQYGQEPSSPYARPNGYPPSYPPAARYAAPAPPPRQASTPWTPSTPTPSGPQVQAEAVGAPSRPLLLPLVGTLAWRAEVNTVLGELVAHLSVDNAAKVRGVPLVFDNNANDVNAFAGCDDKGAPFVAATEGLLEVIDAISQTQAADELFGSRTYDTYANAISVELVKPHGASPALPLGVIPAAELVDPRRLSRAHELFDEIVAFTFGHELSHHYLGHTGCANGDGSRLDPAAFGRLFSNLAPGFNQPNELAADSAGAINVLDTGRARVPAYRWTERGGLTLLDFFSRMDRAAGISPLNPIGFLQTHPNPAFRVPTLQLVARTWALQHPG